MKLECTGGIRGRSLFKIGSNIKAVVKVANDVIDVIQDAGDHIKDKIGDGSKGFCVDVPYLWVEYQQLSEFLKIGDEDKRRAMAMCSCYDKLMIYLSEGIGDIAEDAEVNEITASAIDAFSGVLDCFLDSSGTIDSNKEEVIASEKAKDGLFIQGLEVGIRQYSNILVAVGICVSSSKCDDIITIFVNIFKDTVNQIGGELIDALKTYYIDRFTSPFSSLFSELLEQKDRLSRVWEDCRSDMEEGGTEVFEVLKEVRESFAMKIDNIKTMIGLVEETIDLIADAIAVFEETINLLSKSYIDYLNDLILRGYLPNLNSAVEFLANGGDIQKITSNVERIMGFARSIGSDLSELSAAMGRLEKALADLEKDGKECIADVGNVQVTGKDILNRFIESVEKILSDPIGKYHQCTHTQYM